MANRDRRALITLSLRVSGAIRAGSILAAIAYTASCIWSHPAGPPDQGIIVDPAYPEICGTPVSDTYLCTEPPHCFDGKIYKCDPVWNCYNVVACPPDGGCIETDAGPRCGGPAADCDTIARTYALIARQKLIPAFSGGAGLTPGAYAIDCGGTRGCSVIPGHCSLGLGACWYLAGVLDQHQAALDDLASTYQEHGCARATTCDCPPQPAQVSCETNPDGGSWMISPDFTSAYACVVH